MNHPPQTLRQFAQTLNQSRLPILPIPVQHWFDYTDEDFFIPSQDTGFYYFRNDNEEDNLPEIATEEDFHRFLFDLTSREDGEFNTDYSWHPEIVKKYAHWIPPVGQVTSPRITFNDAVEGLEALDEKAMEARRVAAKAMRKGKICCGMHQDPKWDEVKYEENEEEEEMNDKGNDTATAEENDRDTVAKEECQDVGDGL
jgi:hypothetical protein